jgi:alpha-amylase
MKTKTSLFIIGVFTGLLFLNSCNSAETKETAETIPFVWENANIYFLLTDRFFNGDPANDVNFSRTRETGMLRGFEGGDIQGVIKKIEQGYFDRLGITALWLTPWFEQIHGGTDEGTGMTYAYHGYWTSDWTSLDPNFGSEEDLARLVETAHAHGIRVLMDVIINHTGPVTEKDPVWPPEWVRTAPPCTYTSYETTVPCTLVENLPDIRTESTMPVELPPRLLEKWAGEGRLESELAELDAFFERSGYPRAPRYYIIKWLTDFVRKYGIDGYRLDTAKHIEEEVWKELAMEAQAAFEAWKHQHPEKVLDEQDFFMVGEVYGYGISAGKHYSFGDRKVDYFAHGIQSLINFEFKSNAHQSYEELFSSYSAMLAGELKGYGVLNYISSHDDGGPFDQERKIPLEAATKLLLCPGASQIYYGDESSRELSIPGTQGDATLRGRMNWKEIESNASRQGHAISDVMKHYQKLGIFRREHPSVGAGRHQEISKQPYVFSRSYVDGAYTDQVVVGLELESGEKKIDVKPLFEDGTKLYDYYSGTYVTVDQGWVTLYSEYKLVLLGRKKT